MTGSEGGQGPAPAGSGVPTCYRHGERETYIRCSRCEKYICPECMTAAPVGFQCPDCVSEGRKSVRQPRTVLGGEIRENGDLVTKVLIAINVAVWGLVMLVQTGAVSDRMRFLYGANWDEIPARFALVKGYGFDPISLGVVDGEWYRLVTAAFVHMEFWHIGMNMFALWILGGALEPVLGRWRFIALYFLSAAGGSAVSLLAASEYSMSLGASGAVFGLMGALFVVMRRIGRDVTAVLVIVGINGVIGFVVPGIDWRAHLGGLIVGAVLAFVFAHAPRAHRTMWGVGGCVVVAAAIATTVVLTLP